MLMKAIDSYLSVRRAAGFELEVPEYLLRSFARFATQQGQTHVYAQTAIRWAALAPSAGQRRHRLNTVIRFARYIRAEDQRHEIPPQGVFGPKPQRRIPFIFATTEILRLVQEAYRLGPAGSLRPYTYATLFSLLSATGIRISEALSLRLDDVAEDGLVIRQTKFKKSRLVPLHETASVGLKRYLIVRARMVTGDDHVFVSLYERALSYRCVYEVFNYLIERIGLNHSPGRPRPHIHDIRHSFAVRVLETCCAQSRDDIGRNMLALSTYLGHTNVADTYWYLEATPQLMADIAQACETFMQGGKGL
ncbi:MAG: tyrosine-type recombinase/integrase [Deltaproteobacteria bacterium]|nr:tyrosine-type recombinase/integrase [Deltaproteobacteria bacterium]